MLQWNFPSAFDPSPLGNDAETGEFMDKMVKSMCVQAFDRQRIHS